MKIIKMPKFKGKDTSGTIVCWCKSPGDPVVRGDTLARIEIEDSFVELQAGCAGRLEKTLVALNETANIDQPIAEMATDKTERDNSGKTNTKVSLDMSKKQTAENVTPILMPQVGNDMEEGTIVKWQVAQGASIAVGDVIFEVETDKATIEIEADNAGRLSKIVAGEGQTVAVKTPVAYLADNDADVEAYLAAGNEVATNTDDTTTKNAVASTPAPTPVASTGLVVPQETGLAVPQEGRVKASPAARKLATELGVNLSTVAGTGPDGRIISTDIPAMPVAAAAASGKPIPAPAPAVTSPIGETTRTKLAGIRKAIATNLSKSKQSIPHFYLTLTVNAEAMMNYYRSRKPQYKCTVNDVVLMACGRALHEFPTFRSRLEGEEVVELPTANIGLAVGIENGLVVPVMKDVDRLSFQQIAGESKRLAESARNGKVENMGRGSFTITNLGMFGVEQFGAIINPPESAILAVGAAREAIIVENGAMKPGRVMTATLSCDHRVIDGMQAAQFAARLKELLENPQVM